jgi:hypothetical protein
MESIRKLIDDRRIKSISKLESWLTHKIVKNTMSLQIDKSSTKTESLLNLKSSMITEWQMTYGIDSVTKIMNDTSNL